MKLRLLASILSVLTFSAQAAAPGQYSVTSLGALTGLDLNNHGQVVGYVSSGAGAQQASIYNGGVVSAIAGATGVSVANGINDAGQISGYFGQYSEHGFLYSSGSLTSLNMTVVGIDNQGNVGGTAAEQLPFGSYKEYAAVYANGQTTMGSLGGQYIHPIGMSKDGTLYGFGNTADSVGMNPFTYKNGVMTDYSSIMGDGALIAGANAHNQLLGTNIGSGLHFTYFNGVLEYQAAGIGFDSINNSGWAVGAQQDLDNLSFLKGLLLVDGVSYDLNSLVDPAAGWNITSASVINENNQILAQGCNATGCGSLLLSPLAAGSPAGFPLAGPVAAVPEPETYGMMLMGMAAIGVAARRRRKQAAK